MSHDSWASRKVEYWSACLRWACVVGGPSGYHFRHNMCLKSAGLEFVRLANGRYRTCWWQNFLAAIVNGISINALQWILLPLAKKMSGWVVRTHPPMIKLVFWKLLENRVFLWKCCFVIFLKDVYPLVGCLSLSFLIALWLQECLHPWKSP